MTEGSAPLDAAAEPTSPPLSEERAGFLSGTRADQLAVAAVVASLFFQRLDRTLYQRGTSAIPDVTFDAAIVVLSLRYLHELVRGRLRLGRVTRREYATVGFLVLVVVLGAASVLSLPHWMWSSTQVAKSSIHLAFLAYAAILIGRTVSRELLGFALKLYFWLASAAAVLAVVQAVDLNAGHSFLTRHLHLVFRQHPNGYKAPCSIFSEPAQLGYTMVAALVVGVLLWRSIGLRRTIAGGTLCVVALLLAFPAGATLVAVVLGLIIAVERRPRLGRRTWSAAGVLVVVLAAVAVASPVGSALYDRASGIVSGSDPSAQYRTAVDNASIRIWKLAPATGIGIGDSREVLPFVFHFHAAERTTPQRFNDSNAYLSLLAETGVFGLAGGLVLLAAFIWPSTRPVRFTTVTQLNTLGVALSYVVAGSFLLPPLWFWGGLRLASIRSDGKPDLFETSLAALRRRLVPARPPALPSTAKVRAIGILRPALVVLVLAAVAGAGYALGAQKRTSSSQVPVTVTGVAQLSPVALPGDRQLARDDVKIWGKCGKHCHASLHHVKGRFWQINARWRSGRACLVLDLSNFRETHGPARGLAGRVAGLAPAKCG